MKPRTRTIALGMTLAFALAVPVSGCGGDDSGSSNSDAKTKEKTTAAAPASGGGATLALAADPGGKLAFDKKTLSAKAGKTTIAFANTSSVPHAVEVEGKGVEKKTKTISGGKANLALNLKPGTYEFYCPVDGHRQAGMKGELVVK
jgi:plastocyanin